MFEAFVSGFVQVFTVPTLPLLLLGVLVGFAVGMLPGLGPSAALSLMLPYTFSMQPVEAFAFLLGMGAATGTGSDITAILFGVPGDADSAATMVDGRPMARNGEAGRALGAALTSSLFGGLIGAFVLALSIPVIRPLVLSFGAPEFFALSVLGICFVAAVSEGSRLKGLIAGGMGLFLALVGLDSQTSTERYTLGFTELWDGIGLVPIVVGLYAIPELAALAVHGAVMSPTHNVGKLTGVWQGCRDTFRHWGIAVRGSVVGTFIGFLPGLGGTVAQWIAYAQAVQSSSDKSKFGQGDVRGVIGPSAANNAKEGGGLIPTIAFGVPGNSFMAILLGAFMIQGLRPGAEMLTTKLSLTFSMVWILIVANVVAITLCFLFLRWIVRIVTVPIPILITVITVLVLLGGYTSTNSMASVLITVIAGLLGLAMVYLGLPRAPLILGLVLGNLIERYFFISYTRYEFAFLARPLVIVIFTILLLVLFWPVLTSLFKAYRRRGE